MNLSFTLCPESVAALPAKGRSAFVRAAILAFGKTAPPASVEPVAVAPAPVVAEPVTWRRSWHRPRTDVFPDGFDFGTLVWDKQRKIFLNPPPWPAFPSLNMEQARNWGQYVDRWGFPDPFPGPLEWHSMGEPVEPLPEHRAIEEPVAESPVAESPVAESPVAVPAPSQESPLPVAVPAPSQESPLPVAGVSSNILEEI